MKQDFFSFSNILSFPVADTDKGSFLLTKEGLKKQFLMKGKIVKSRAGLFYVQIEEKIFTAHKNSQFHVGQNVACVVEPILKDTQVEDFVIVGLEKMVKKQ